MNILWKCLFRGFCSICHIILSLSHSLLSRIFSRFSVEYVRNFTPPSCFALSSIKRDTNGADERFFRMGVSVSLPDFPKTCWKGDFSQSHNARVEGWRHMGPSVCETVRLSFYLVCRFYKTVRVCVSHSHWFTGWRQIRSFNAAIYPDRFD